MLDQNTIHAKYYDGKSARQHHVMVQLSNHIGAEGLRITFSDQSEVIWRFSELREVTDQAREDGIVLSNDDDGIARLIIPDRSAEDIIRAKAPLLRKKKVQKPMLRKLAIWLCGAAVSVVLILFVILPALSNQLANLIPVEREEALGRVSMTQISRFIGHGRKDLNCTDETGMKALEKLTARIIGDTEIPYDLKVHVFDHQMINAFALPGGHVILFKGLLEAADTPEEVAGVLGHEIGHVVGRDPTRMALRSAGSIGILGMVFGDFAGGTLALAVTEQLISAQYSQEAETKADEFAHQLMADAGLPSASFANFFHTLQDKYGDLEGVLSRLSSHPHSHERSEAALEADVVGDKPFIPILSEEEWSALRNICK